MAGSVLAGRAAAEPVLHPADGEDQGGRDASTQPEARRHGPGHA